MFVVNVIVGVVVVLQVKSIIKILLLLLVPPLLLFLLLFLHTILLLLLLQSDSLPILLHVIELSAQYCYCLYYVGVSFLLCEIFVFTRCRCGITAIRAQKKKYFS